MPTMGKPDDDFQANFTPLPDDLPPIVVGIPSPTSTTGQSTDAGEPDLRTSLGSDDSGVFLKQAIQLLEDTYELAVDEITESIKRNLNEAKQAYTDALAEIQGKYILDLDASEKIAVDTIKKVDKAIKKTLGEAYTASFDAGVPYPSMEQVQFGLETDNALISNFMSQVNGQPYLIGWNESLLGPPPDFSGTNSTSSPTSTPTQNDIQNQFIESTNPPIQGGGGIGDCPPGQVWAQFPDGHYECVIPEYANPCALDPNAPGCQQPGGGGGTGGGTGGGGTGGGGGGLNDPCHGLVLYQDVGHLTGRSVTCEDQNVTMWEYVFRTGDVEWINFAVGQTPPPTYLFEGHLDTMNFGAKIVNRNYCVLGGENIAQGCIPQGGEGPPPSTGEPPKQCPLPPEKPQPPDCPNEVDPICIANYMATWENFPESIPEGYKTADKATLEKLAKWLCFKQGFEIKRTDPKNPPGELKECGLFSILPPNWCDENVVSHIDSFNLSIPETGVILARQLGVCLDSKGKVQPNGLHRLLSVIPFFGDKVADTVSEIIIDICNLVVGAKNLAGQDADVKVKGALVADGVLALAEWLRKVTGFPPKSWLRRYELAVNALAPTDPPSIAETVGMYMGNEIDEQTLDTLIGAWDVCPQWMRKVVHAQRSRPDVRETILLWLRGHIDNFQYLEKMRSLGVLHDEDRIAFEKLAEWIPGPSDIISMMVKDVADMNVVNELGLDDEFELKWQGDLAKFGDAMGISKDVARLLWRAHWQNISPTMLYDMVARLRPGRVGDNLVVTDEMARHVLAINDYVPFWRDRLLAIAQHPLNLSDLKVIFRNGTIDAEELFQRFLDLHYEESSAVILTKHYEIDKVRYERSVAGLPTAREYINAFVAGYIPVAELQRRLQEMKWSDQRVQSALGGAYEKRRLAGIKRDLNLVKKSYVRFRMLPEEARGRLVDLDLDAETIEYNMSAWDIERESKYKTISASQACQMVNRGIVDVPGYLRLLSRLGFSPTELGNVADLCFAQNAEKSAKAAKQARKEAEAENRRIVKEAEKKQAQEDKKRKAEEKKREACIPKKKRCEALGVPTEEEGDSGSKEDNSHEGSEEKSG